jgi:hypothetical protein
VQIAKLRFFISLIIDQKFDDNKPNRGILTLPNLETKFVAANTLIGLSRVITAKPISVYSLEDNLKDVRHTPFFGTHSLKPKRSTANRTRNCANKSVPNLRK